MTEAEYREWAQNCHGALFAMRSEDDLDLFRAWKPLLAIFEFAELKEASLWIASNRAERYRTQHLQLLQERIRQRQIASMAEYYRASMAEANERERRERCNECEGRGKLTVPHLSQIQDGRWVPTGRTYYEAVVCCRCRLGNTIREKLTNAFAKIEKGMPPLSIAEYEMHNPDWHRQVAERAQNRKSQDEAERHARHVDKKLGPLAWIQGQVKRLLKGPKED